MPVANLIDRKFQVKTPEKYGRFHGEDKYTTKESERLLRLPLYYGLEEEKVLTVCEKIKEFYSK